MSNLLRLTYASTAEFEPVYNSPGIEVSVARILMQSRRNNPKRRIGGVLHYGDGYFFQCLEGPRDQVNDVYQVIAADPRHRDVQLLSALTPDERAFGNWSMKYVPVEGTIKTLLARHGVERFQPYEFSDQLVNELLRECIRGGDPTARTIEPHAAAPGDRPSNRPGLWARLLGKAHQPT